MRSYNETVIPITSSAHAGQIKNLAKGFPWILKRNDLLAVYTFSATQQKRLQVFLDKKKQHIKHIPFNILFDGKTRRPANMPATASFS